MNKVYTIFIIAVLVGIFFIIFNPHPSGKWGFDHYDQLGWNLAQGNGYSPSSEAPFYLTAFRMPGYPILLSFFYRIFGHKYMPVYIFQLFLNAFIPVFIFFMTKNFFASFLVALLSFSNVYVSSLSSDMLATFFTVLAVFSLYKKRYFFHGFALGLATMMRPSMVLLPIFYFAFFLLSKQKAFKYLILSCLGMALLISPWAIRNYRLTNKFIPLTTQGGSQFYTGALESGKYFDCWAYNPYCKSRYPSEMLGKGIVDEIERQSLQYNWAFAYIREHPKEYFTAVLKKTIRMWIVKGSSDIVISHPSPVFKIAKYFTSLILGLAILGIFVVKKNLEQVFLLVPIFYFLFTHPFFRVNGRHTLPVNPFMLVFVGFGLLYLKNKLRDRYGTR